MTLQLLTMLMYGIYAALMLGRLDATVSLMLRQKSILAFAVLALLSASWSQDPFITLRKAAFMLILFAFAWFFAATYTPSDQMRLLLAAGVIVGLVSVAWVLLLPQYGLDQGGAWKGVFGQKNQFGQGVLYLFSGLAFLRTKSRGQATAKSLLAAMSIVLIAMSRSKGALLLLFVILTIRLCMSSLTQQRREKLPAMMYAFLLSMLTLAFGRDALLSLIGRDSTLTGRTDEWSVLLTYVHRHVWLGYGYQAFWLGTGDSLEAMHFIRGVINGADSGYLDTLLQFGISGIVLWLLLLCVSVRDLVALRRKGSMSDTDWWFAALILITFIGSFIENVFLKPGGITTFTFVVACAGLGRSSENAQSNRAWRRRKYGSTQRTFECSKMEVIG
jgi:O-antigen ligase